MLVAPLPAVSDPTWRDTGELAENESSLPGDDGGGDSGISGDNMFELCWWFDNTFELWWFDNMFDFGGRMGDRGEAGRAVYDGTVGTKGGRAYCCIYGLLSDCPGMD